MKILFDNIFCPRNGLLLLVVLSISACNHELEPTGVISGKIQFWNGNFMPGPGSAGGQIYPAYRQVYVREVTTSNEVVDADATFFSEVLTPLIGMTFSGEDGLYEIEVPVGLYSVFIWEDGSYIFDPMTDPGPDFGFGPDSDLGFYANSYSSAGIQVVEVFTDETTELDIDITYNAFF